MRSVRLRSDFAVVPGSGAWIAGLKGDVQRAGGTGTGALDDVEIDHGGGDDSKQKRVKRTFRWT